MLPWVDFFNLVLHKPNRVKGEYLDMVPKGGGECRPNVKGGFK
jgi:hypothetical protein